MPLVTVVGPMFASLATGTIFVEQIFGIPGLGHYFTEAAVSRDMPLLMGRTFFFAALVMVMNLLVDLSYAALDPRVRADMGLLSTGSVGPKRHEGTLPTLGRLHRSAGDVPRSGNERSDLMTSVERP